MMNAGQMPSGQMATPNPTSGGQTPAPASLQEMPYIPDGPASLGGTQASDLGLAQWSPWSQRDGSTAIWAPAVTSRGENRLDLFAVGLDSQVYHQSWNGSQWSPWKRLENAVSITPPTAVFLGSNQVSVFWVGTDKQVYYRRGDGNQWSNVESLGGTVIHGLAATSWGSNRIDLFAVGTDSSLYQNIWNGSTWSGWKIMRFKGLSSVEKSATCIAAPAAVSWGANRIDIFALGIDNGVYHAWGDGTSEWKGWENLGGPCIQGVAAASRGVNRLDLFAISTDTVGTDNHLYYRSGNGSNWSRWENLGGACISAPTAVAQGEKRLDVFVVGTRSAIWQKSWSAASGELGVQGFESKLQKEDITWLQKPTDLSQYCLPYIKRVDEWLEGLLDEDVTNERIIPALQGQARLKLLNGLANTIHRYIACAWYKWKELSSSLSGKSFENFLKENCLVTQYAVERMMFNFINNIRIACARLIQDWDDVHKLFFLSDEKVITKLVNIHSTGSDSHKGGLQVLILTFECKPLVPDIEEALPKPTQVKLIYKPSDVEIDYRIVARTHGIGTKGVSIKDLNLVNLPKQLLELSLTEKVNQFLGKDKFQLPTYRIYPRNPGSLLAENTTNKEKPALNVRESYGYIEFLTYLPEYNEDNGDPLVPYNVEKADWIFKNDERISNYFHQCGRLLAMTSAFSITDLHAGNLIVHSRQAHAIDLEICFSRPTEGVNETGLIGDPISSGISGAVVVELLIDEKHPNFVYSKNRIRRHASPKENYFVSSKTESEFCAVQLYLGYLETMISLKENVKEILSLLNGNDFNKCVARHIIYTTEDLFKAMKRLYKEQCNQIVPKYEEDLREIFKLHSTKDGTLRDFANNYRDTFEDLLKCDFPVYYTRLSEKWIYNSKGDRVMGLNDQPCQLPESKFDIVFKQIQNFTNSELFLKRVCQGLRQISTQCEDKIERIVTVKTITFVKKQDEYEWKIK